MRREFQRLLCLILFGMLIVATAGLAKTVTYQFSVGPNGDRRTFDFAVKTAGPIKATATWIGNAQLA